jgi:hypothetical protein
VEVTAAAAGTVPDEGCFKEWATLNWKLYRKKFFPRFEMKLTVFCLLELKQRFYKALADGLHEGVKLRREDVFINLVEVPKVNWSYGNGEAQYAK